MVPNLAENSQKIFVHLYIKTHGSVSCGPRSRRHTMSILTGRKKPSFSHLCISVIPYPIGTKFATELPASQGSPHSKFEGNRSSRFQDTSCQSFNFFSQFFFFVFLHICKNCYKTQTRTPIALKFGTQKEQGRIQGGLWGLKPPLHFYRLYLINMLRIIMKFCLSIII